jgi:hypothetical protein
MKQRESVTMPTNPERSPQLESAFNCRSIASFWSEPNLKQVVKPPVLG